MCIRDSSHSDVSATEPQNENETNKSSGKSSLIGYIHIQYADGENSTIIKKRAEKIFQTAGIKAWIQVEAQQSPCWCRATSMKEQVAI